MNLKKSELLPSQFSEVTDRSIIKHDYRELSGSSWEETSLWTNDNPSTTFPANQTLTLSDSISNYDYLRIYYRATTTSSIYSSVIIPTDAFYPKADGNVVFSIGGIYTYGGSVTPMSRYVYYVDNVTINIVNNSNQSLTGNLGIPVEIYGVNL